LNYLKQYPLKKCDTISNDDGKKSEHNRLGRRSHEQEQKLKQDGDGYGHGIEDEDKDRDEDQDLGQTGVCQVVGMGSVCRSYQALKKNEPK